ncbi:MAG: 23S rRNA (adenine(2503)-C(2))-methyltransferase RlmN [Myxococcaceae bacterium]|jgi:23S rRNA (adenine2503-C2)-methyltransferase|nr:23S rRNA (adenine(2503)-C(2))-methyltransferase RlmN [Myxococcaceae bacterium]
MRNLPGLTLDELTRELSSRQRALELLKWLGAQRSLPTALPEVVPGVSHRVWGPFREKHGLTTPTVVERSVSEDGTTKYALDLSGSQVETVRIPAKGRSTICISSQAGCTRKCVFCATKELGFIRQLKAEEMVAQYLLARSEAPADAPARNVVFMGMGEPMDNLDEVLRAVEVLTQGPFPQLKYQSVTVSTSGVLPGMVRFLKESKASLALSLNATTDEVRTRVMPQNKTWPIAALMEALREAAERDPDRDTFVEYVLFKDVNDTDADADRLVALLRGLPARVNLIPYNPYPGTGLETPTHERVLAFHQRVVAQGQLCLVRWPRGREIAAACGQLVLAQDGAGFVPAAV